jgi:hypothetical protein
MHQNDLQKFVDTGYKDYLQGISIDCAVFGFHEGLLKVLLLKWKGLKGWSLPGGYIKKNEEADAAARRLLKERTGLDHIYLKQYHTFTHPDRAKIPKISLKDFEKAFGIHIKKDNWLFNRMISIGYLALVEYSKVKGLTADDFTERCEWKDVRDLPPVLFDHQEMIETALKHIRQQVSYQPLGLTLLPEKFTMGELQQLYETILGHTLDRGNFRKKILALGIVTKTGERPTGKPHKTPYLYSFDKRAYTKAVKNGIGFIG